MTAVTALGVMLVMLGAVLVVAEAHLPSGAFGVAGGVALITGGVVVIGALGGGLAVALPVAVGLGVGVAGWTLAIARQAAGSRRVRIRAGAESLSGRVGVVRSWHGPTGRVFVEGALWRARQDLFEGEEDGLSEGDQVVVEQVNGLTLRVRRAEDWELIA